MAGFEFTPAFGNRPSQLVGREPLISTLLGGLDSRPGSKERAIVMLGQRGYGKTVMLLELAERAKERGFVVASPTSVREGLVERVVEKLQDDGVEELGNRRVRLSGGSVGALGFSVSLQFSDDEKDKSAEYKLTKICRELTRQKLGTLILIDELQGNSSEIRRLVGTYQELVGEKLDVAMVLAGLPSSISGTLNDRVLTFLNRARKVTLGPLETGDIDAFYRKAFRASGVEIPQELRRRAATATCGSPYLMQLVGHYLVAYADGGKVDEALFEEAMQSAQWEYENDICEATLSGLSPTDRKYLRAMAELGGTCRTSEVAKRMGVSADYGQRYRRRLLDAGAIEAPASGTVRFSIPYLVDYLLRE